MKQAIVRETSELAGYVEAPSSKSYTHRAIIAASLAEGKSRLTKVLFCDDSVATINACSMLGASIEEENGNLLIDGASELTAPKEAIDCKESGSTIRFMTPIAALAKGITVLTGSPSLKKRPIGQLTKSLKQLGVRCTSQKGFPPVKVFGGEIKGGKTSIAGNISSQFVSGLLLACPLARNDTEVTLTTDLESKPYVELTLQVQRGHDVTVEASEDFRKYSIPGGQKYKPFNHTVPGDFSSASFLLSAAAVTNSNITVENLPLRADQPDSEIIDILKGMNANVTIGESWVKVSDGRLRGMKIDARNTPDLVPVCAVLACFAEGKTKIYNAERLRIKESDRLASISSELKKMGARVSVLDGGLIIIGPSELHGATVDSHDDHRIAMACAVAALGAKGETKILRAECVSKSYPEFFDDLRTLGGNVVVR